MPVTRKQQVLAKIETADGQAETLTGADALLVYEPDVTEDVNFLDRVPAGPTLSRDNTPPGVQTRGFPFQADFRGSGSQSTAPDWGKLARACAFQEAALTKIPLTGVSGTFQIGEIVEGASSSDQGLCVVELGADGDIYYLPLKGTIGAAATVTGLSSGATGTAGTPDLSGGFGYAPDSLRLINVTLSAAFSPADPPAGGPAVTISRSGEVVGACQLVTKNSTTDWDVTLLWGGIASGDVLSDGTNSATISGTPTQTRTPSLTIKNNKDGFQRTGAGCRGDFTLAGQSGEPLVFSFTFTGNAHSHGDELPVATSGLGSIRAPRLFGAIVGFGAGSEFYKMPVRSLEFTPGNTVGNRLDANAAGGSNGTVITDRDASITIEVEQAGTTFDWINLRNSETNIRFGALLGTGTGTRVAIAAANCQITELPDGDADGFATFQVTLKPRRIEEAGDDEIVLAMF